MSCHVKLVHHSSGGFVLSVEWYYRYPADRDWQSLCRVQDFLRPQYSSLAGHVNRFSTVLIMAAEQAEASAYH
jgi:hypothetical protein